jgi:hypothetical protein
MDVYRSDDYTETPPAPDSHVVAEPTEDGAAGPDESVVYRCDDYDALKAAGQITRELGPIETTAVAAPEPVAAVPVDVQVETA